MRVIKSVGLILLGVVLGIAGSLASPRVEARAATAIQPGQPAGTIITSENIGFQLIATEKQGEVATGKLMIRINGRWLPAAAPTGLIPAR
jgi:hypothetical protein